VIRFNNLQDLPCPEPNEEYIFNKDGWNYIECFSGYGKFTDNVREKWMYASIINLIYLNPKITKNEIIAVAESANVNKLYPVLSEKEIYKMVDVLWRRNLLSSLKPLCKRKKIIFNEAFNLSGEKRKLLSLQAINKMKCDRKMIDLYNIVESWDFHRNGKITQRAIIKLKAGIGKKAVEKYYRHFIGFINMLNFQFKTE
jgi:hypothetical protein